MKWTVIDHEEMKMIGKVEEIQILGYKILAKVTQTQLGFSQDDLFDLYFTISESCVL